MADETPNAPGSSPPRVPAGEMSEEKIAAAKAKAEALKAQRSWATAENPGAQPATAPQNPKIQALGTITQSVELRCEASEDPNVRKLLGGLGAYKNPIRGAWQLDYRYYEEALKRLRAAGYQVEGKDYLGRPLEQWSPEGRGWTRLGPG